ncbi:hypothetical protein BV20DRAFT_1099882 [Pilatotrama ljubarskyi]|nr:hypothetical protein BV20DRAFT_1099882 [Pilatotrama ljubarskyi]
MPILFRQCAVASHKLDWSPEDPTFLPQSLWPFVHRLKFHGSFKRTDLSQCIADDYLPDDPERVLEPLRRLASAKKLGSFVKHTLDRMPSLHTVHISISHDYTLWGPWDMPGVSWYILEAILSTPHICRFLVDGPLSHPMDRLPPDMSPLPTIPMMSFIYRIMEYRHPPRVTEMEKGELLLVLDGIHASVMQLVLPSEPTPLHRMHLWDWPDLRELSLYGERPVHADQPPLVMMLGRMLRLRVLSLTFAEAEGSTSPMPLWPTSLQASFEWRDLEQLTVTHPHPDDEFYAHLPQSLERLALRCWPRYYKHHCILRESMDQAEVRWTSPLLASSDMLRILRKSATPHLDHLELEFRADYNDEKLFRHIASSYPRLTVLRVHRYQEQGESVPPVARIANALHPLARLRLLMIYLEFPELPDVTLQDGRHYYNEEFLPEMKRIMDAAYATMQSAAQTFARVLAPSLEYVCFLSPMRGRLGQWIPYRVTRSANDGYASVQYVGGHRDVDSCGYE